MYKFLGIPGWIILGSIGAWIATTKGRSGCFWFLLCGVLGPIAIVVAAILPKKE